MARLKQPKPIYEQTPDTSPTAGNDGQLNAVLKSGIETIAGSLQFQGVLDAGLDTISQNRPDITPILKAARAAKESTP